MNIIHITHSDLDAVGCDVMIRVFYSLMKRREKNNLNIKTFFCNVSRASKTVWDLMDKIKNGLIETPDVIYITDISITDKCAEELDRFRKERYIGLVHIDHHPTDHLNEKFEWSKVDAGEPFKSATMLTYEHFMNNHEILKDCDVFYDSFPSIFEELHRLAQKISRYDTWLWKKDPTDYSEEYFNICCNFYGLEDYSNKLVNAVIFGDNLIDETDNVIVHQFLKKREKEVNNFIADPTRIYFKEEDGMKFAYIMHSGEFTNSIMEAVYLNYSDVDIVACFFPITRLLSYRSNKPHVDCGKYASEKFGGGGHKTAAGAQFIDIDVYTSMLNEYYKAVDENKKAARKKKV